MKRANPPVAEARGNIQFKYKSAIGGGISFTQPPVFRSFSYSLAAQVQDECLLCSRAVIERRSVECPLCANSGHSWGTMAERLPLRVKAVWRLCALGATFRRLSAA